MLLLCHLTAACETEKTIKMKIKHIKIESHESLEINLGSPCVYNYDTFFFFIDL